MWLIYSDSNGNSIKVEDHSINKIRTIFEKHGVKNIKLLDASSFFRLFRNALIEQNNDFCNALIDSGIPIANLIRNSDKKTLFHVACQVRKVNYFVLENLLRNGANINAQMRNGYTPLHLSLQTERHIFENLKRTNKMICYEVFRNTKFLIKNGANVDIYDKNGNTPLHYAIDWNNYEALKVILNQDIPVEVENRCLYTIKGLLKKKVLFNYSPHRCLFLLKYSIINKDLESLKYIMSNTKIDSKSFFQNNASEILSFAAIEGGPQYIKFLIDYGADPSAHDSENCCPIVNAIREQKIESIRCLLDCGALVNCALKFHFENSTPLISAVLKQSIEIVEMLLKEGADVDTLANDMTPLMVACGDRVSIHNHISYRPSYKRTYNLKIVNLLLDHGANIEKQNLFGQTALSQACMAGNLKIVKILLSRGAKIERNYITTLNYAIAGGHPDIVKIILEQGFSVNSSCSRLGTALEHAISLVCRTSTEYMPVLEFLLRHIAKMMSTKKYLNRKNLELLEDESIKKIYKMYAEELTTMKERNISPEFNFSYFDILTKDIDYLGGALRKEELILVLNEGKYQQEFHNYSKDLENRIEEAIHRRQLVELAGRFMQKYVNKKISFEVFLLIFKNLLIKDLNNFLFVSLFYQF